VEWQVKKKFPRVLHKERN